MNSDRVFEAAIRTAKNLLGQNLQPEHLPDAATVLRLLELVNSPSIRAALLHSSDTLLAFVLRAVEQVVADRSQTDREIITRLWDVLARPGLAAEYAKHREMKMVPLTVAPGHQVALSPGAHSELIRQRLKAWRSL